MDKSIGKKISKNVSGKCGPGLLDVQSATDALKTASKRAIRNTAATSYLIGNEIAVTKSQKSSPQIVRRLGGI